MHCKYLYFKNSLIFILLLLVSCTNDSNLKKNELGIIETSSLQAEKLKVDENGLSFLKAEIRTAHGNIILKFYPKHAPATVNRVIQLIEEGFYNGLSFSRVITDYLIQTGDPTETGDGGSGKKLKAEVSKLQHIKGTVAMARFEDKLDSADSQFYITLNNATHLDGTNTIFGQVIDGFNVINKIILNDKVISITILPEGKGL
jgi:cyclophilin family peptidyl-prolyl cis-trans isomerase